jgi:hypothetical protein
MTILLIAEARSGSTNLAKWLSKSLPDFRFFNEPFNYRSSDFVGENGTIDYSKNNIISEKYYFNEPLIKEMVKKSDKVFCLRRLNTTEQLESYIMAHKTNNWYDEYVAHEIYQNIDEMHDLLFKFAESKRQLKMFIDNANIKSFTYEDMYFNNGIDDLKSFLDITSDIPFPYGEKYRKEIINKTTI